MSDQRQAFEDLWRTEYARVFRTAYLVTGDMQEAADVTQEAFVRAYERWPSVFRLERPGAWVQRIATNLAISWRRRQRVRRLKGPNAHQASSEMDARDPDLMAALLLLTPAQRAVIVLRFYCDQSVEDTARALRKRPGTVKALTSQAADRLRSLLAEAEDEIRR